jgi:hypothetical protein
VSFPSSGLKIRQTRNPNAYCLLQPGFWLGFLFNPEDEGYMFLRNVN